MNKTFHVVIEKDEDGLFFGFVPGMRGAHSQGATEEELMERMKEVIALVLEDQHADDVALDFIAVRELSLAV